MRVRLPLMIAALTTLSPVALLAVGSVAQALAGPALIIEQEPCTTEATARLAAPHPSSLPADTTDATDSTDATDTTATASQDVTRLLPWCPTP